MVSHVYKCLPHLYHLFLAGKSGTLDGCKTKDLKPQSLYCFFFKLHKHPTDLISPYEMCYSSANAFHLTVYYFNMMFINVFWIDIFILQWSCWKTGKGQERGRCVCVRMRRDRSTTSTRLPFLHQLRFVSLRCQKCKKKRGVPQSFLLCSSLKILGGQFDCTADLLASMTKRCLIYLACKCDCCHYCRRDWVRSNLFGYLARWGQSQRDGEGVLVGCLGPEATGW